MQPITQLIIIQMPDSYTNQTEFMDMVEPQMYLVENPPESPRSGSEQKQREKETGLSLFMHKMNLKRCREGEDDEAGSKRPKRTKYEVKKQEGGMGTNKGMGRKRTKVKQVQERKARH